jgi:hypothetical protein
MLSAKKKKKKKEGTSVHGLLLLLLLLLLSCMLTLGLRPSCRGLGTWKYLKPKKGGNEMHGNRNKESLT